MLLEALVFTGVYPFLSVIVDRLSGVKLHLSVYVASAVVGFIVYFGLILFLSRFFVKFQNSPRE